MRIHYPKIEGGQDINGWTNHNHKVYNLKVGGFVEMEDEKDVDRFLSTFPFLTKAEGRADTEEVKQETPHEVQSQAIESLPWGQLVKKARELGIYKVGLTKDELIELINKQNG
jgi:hypothetical protein